MHAQIRFCGKHLSNSYWAFPFKVNWPHETALQVWGWEWHSVMQCKWQGAHAIIVYLAQCHAIILPPNSHIGSGNYPALFSDLQGDPSAHPWCLLTSPFNLDRWGAGQGLIWANLAVMKVHGNSIEKCARPNYLAGSDSLKRVHL